VAECEVWWATPAMREAWHDAVLSTAERDRLAGLRREIDQNRSAVGAVLLRLAAADRLGVEPAEVPVERHCPDCERPHGKPSLPGTGLYVSISHSGDRVAVAVTTAGPVGVDVEEIGAVDPAELARLVLGPGESATTPELFLTYWTRKEAVVKATGDGLRAPLAEILVSGPDEPPRLLGYRGDSPPAAVLTDLDGGPGYRAALAVLTAGTVEVIERDAGAMLGSPPRRVLRRTS